MENLQQPIGSEKEELLKVIKTPIEDHSDKKEGKNLVKLKN